MYTVTFRVDESKLHAFIDSANAHGTLQRCSLSTDGFELRINELNAIRSDVAAISNRLEAMLLYLQDQLEKANLQ